MWSETENCVECKTWRIETNERLKRSKAKAHKVLFFSDNFSLSPLCLKTLPIQQDGATSFRINRTDSNILQIVSSHSHTSSSHPFLHFPILTHLCLFFFFFLSTEPDSRYLIGISGIPASGKSALARNLIASINSQVGDEIARLVGMDGWHYSRKQLDAFPDPKEARDRRGAAFTFDAQVSKLEHSESDWMREQTFVKGRQKKVRDRMKLPNSSGSEQVQDLFFL